MATPSPDSPGAHSPGGSLDALSSGELPTIGGALAQLSGVHDRGIWFEGELTPWSTAVAESRARARMLAERLDAGSRAAAGAGPDAAPRAESEAPPHVGVLLENTPEYLFLLGAAALEPLVVVGLNSTRSGSDLARDIATAHCRLVLTDAAHADLLSGVDLGGIPVIRVDEPTWLEAAAAARGDEAGPPSSGVSPRPDDLLALVFTSGTSGDPKAVRVTQGKIAGPGRMLAERFGIESGDCIYSAMPLFHSNALLVAWPMAVIAGASIAVRRRFSASGWLDDVRRYGCTFANYVGAPLTYILATPERPGDADNPVRIVYGNEAPADVRRRFAERFGVRVVDGFGSTEGGVAISRTPETPAAALGPLPAGVLVVSDDDRPCPRAELSAAGEVLNPDEAIGELVREGPGLFAGYYNDPAADAERMRGGRYRSGDLAYVDAGGFVYFAGRTSGWMRVDGENLAAAPIERVLQGCPGVAQVAVYSIPATLVDRPVGDAVMAAVVLEAGVGAGDFADRFRDFVAASSELGPKQRPRALRITAELPRTASFKVRSPDLRALGLDAGPTGDAVFRLD